MSTDELLLESNRQFIGGWRNWARQAPSGDVGDMPGISIAWAHTTLPLCNALFLSRPIDDEADLRARTEAVVAYAGQKGPGWFFFVCQEWLPEDVRARSRSIFADFGLVAAMDTTGMACDDLAAPRRELPQLKYRRIADTTTRRTGADINTISYHMPIEWGHEAFDHGWIWTDTVFGFVGYEDDKPVTTSTTLLVDGRLYVALVATLPSYRKKGYAEAVMRHSLEQARAATGVSRTVLHATEAGLPLYREMGYHDVSTITAYTVG